MEIYVLEATPDKITLVDVAYPGIAFSMADYSLTEDGLEGDVTVLQAERGQHEPIPDDMEEHTTAIFNEFLTSVVLPSISDYTSPVSK